MKFGIAFCEASGPTLLRFVGNDEAMLELARKNGMALAAGHTFLIFMDKGFPVNILTAVKNVPEVCHVFCATANPTEVVIAETAQGRGILGVVDGYTTKGVETEADIVKRKQFLRTIGYKL
jgi:adenosine/AMP kinase